LNNNRLNCWSKSKTISFINYKDLYSCFN